MTLWFIVQVLQASISSPEHSPVAVVQPPKRRFQSAVEPVANKAVLFVLKLSPFPREA